MGLSERWPGRDPVTARDHGAGIGVLVLTGDSMNEDERSHEQADRAINTADHGEHVIEPDSEIGQAMTRARERWIAADPAETIGVDEEALHKAVTE